MNNDYQNLIDVCPVCFVNQSSPHQQATFLAMFEGEVVDPDTTDEWAGFAVCDECAELNEEGVDRS